jgi:hypothetical protein
MSSIRRSSLISITLGLLTVISATFRSLLLRRRQDIASNAHLSQFPALKFWHGDPGRAQLNFLDSLRYRGFKVAHRTDNHSRWPSHLVATAAENRLSIKRNLYTSFAAASDLPGQSRFMSTRPS